MTKTSFLRDKGKIFKVNNIVCNEDDISMVTMLSLRKLYSDITKKSTKEEDSEDKIEFKTCHDIGSVKPR